MQLIVYFKQVLSINEIPRTDNRLLFQFSNVVHFAMLKTTNRVLDFSPNISYRFNVTLMKTMMPSPTTSSDGINAHKIYGTTPVIQHCVRIKK